MKKIKSIGINKFFIFIVLLIGFILRIIFLDVIPPGLANDEANIILNGQSISQTGKNIPGVVTGIFGIPSGDYISGAHSELSSYFLSVVYFFTGFSSFSSRLPFVFASMGTVVLLFLISKRLFGKNISYITLILATVNPWLIQFGRSGYEAIISAFFYLVAIYVFLISKNWKQLYAFPFLLAGFFSYFSAKILVFPIASSLFLYQYLISGRKRILPAVILNLLVIISLIIYYPLLTRSYPGERIKELKVGSYATNVDFKRTHSIKFTPVELIENKLVENIYDRLEASLGGLSPVFLFLNGQPETSGHLQIPDNGSMFVIDFLFVICGLIFLSRKYLRKLILFLILVTSSLLPNFFDIAHTTYSMRPVILIPILIIVSAVGIWGFFQILSKSSFRIPLILAVFVVYLFLFLRFVFNYYYRLPIENSGTFYFHDRIATHYIGEIFKKYPQTEIVWIVPERHFTLYRYIYFSGLYTNKDNIVSINKILTQQSYRVGNLSIENTCPEKISNDKYYIIDSSLKCKGLEKEAVITDINDAGEHYYLHRDPLCSDYEHHSYPLIRDFQLLRLEKLSTKDFCLNYVQKQD